MDQSSFRINSKINGESKVSSWSQVEAELLQLNTPEDAWVTLSRGDDFIQTAGCTTTGFIIEKSDKQYDFLEAVKYDYTITEIIGFFKSYFEGDIHWDYNIKWEDINPSNPKNPPAVKANVFLLFGFLPFLGAAIFLLEAVLSGKFQWDIFYIVVIGFAISSLYKLIKEFRAGS